MRSLRLGTNTASIGDITPTLYSALKHVLLRKQKYVRSITRCSAVTTTTHGSSGEPIYRGGNSVGCLNYIPYLEVKIAIRNGGSLSARVKIFCWTSADRNQRLEIKKAGLSSGFSIQACSENEVAVYLSPSFFSTSAAASAGAAAAGASSAAASAGALQQQPQQVPLQQQPQPVQPQQVLLQQQPQPVPLQQQPQQVLLQQQPQQVQPQQVPLQQPQQVPLQQPQQVPLQQQLQQVLLQLQPQQVPLQLQLNRCFFSCSLNRCFFGSSLSRCFLSSNLFDRFYRSSVNNIFRRCCGGRCWRSSLRRLLIPIRKKLNDRQFRIVSNDDQPSKRSTHRYGPQNAQLNRRIVFVARSDYEPTYLPAELQQLVQLISKLALHR